MYLPIKQCWFFSIFKRWVAVFSLFFDRVPTPWGFVALVVQATLIFKSSSGCISVILGLL